MFSAVRNENMALRYGSFSLVFGEAQNCRHILFLSSENPAKAIATTFKFVPGIQFSDPRVRISIAVFIFRLKTAIAAALVKACSFSNSSRNSVSEAVSLSKYQPHRYSAFSLSSCLESA